MLSLEASVEQALGRLPQHSAARSSTQKDVAFPAISSVAFKARLQTYTLAWWPVADFADLSDLESELLSPLDCAARGFACVGGATAESGAEATATLRCCGDGTSEDSKCGAAAVIGLRMRDAIKGVEAGNGGGDGDVTERTEFDQHLPIALIQTSSSDRGFEAAPLARLQGQLAAAHHGSCLWKSLTVSDSLTRYPSSLETYSRLVLECLSSLKDMKNFPTAIVRRNDGAGDISAEATRDWLVSTEGLFGAPGSHLGAEDLERAHASALALALFGWMASTSSRGRVTCFFCGNEVDLAEGLQPFDVSGEHRWFCFFSSRSLDDLAQLWQKGPTALKRRAPRPDSIGYETNERPSKRIRELLSGQEDSDSAHIRARSDSKDRGPRQAVSDALLDPSARGDSSGVDARLGRASRVEDPDETDLRNAVMDHLEEFLEPARHCAFVAHEPIPLGNIPQVHCHIHEPSTVFPFYTFVTEGLSARSMPVPESAIEDWGEEARIACSRAEFVLYVRRSDVNRELAQLDHPHPQVSELWYARMVRQLAHLVHQHNLWVWAGHTLLLGEEGWSHLMLVPVGLLEGEGESDVRQGHFGVVPDTPKTPQVTLFALVPLRPDEMNHKRAHGGLASLAPFIGNTDEDDAKPVSFFVDLERPNAMPTILQSLS